MSSTPATSSPAFNQYQIGGVAAAVAAKIDCWAERLTGSDDVAAPWVVFSMMPYGVKLRVGVAPAPEGGDRGYRFTAPEASIDASAQDLDAAIDAAAQTLAAAIQAIG